MNKPSRSYLIVADDFTGANDTGVELRRRGIPVRVVFSWAPVSYEGGGGDSRVIDTESRSLPENEAFQKIVSEVEKIPFAKFDRVIKKVDSTLRGNIGAETRALSLCFKPDLIVFAPALPDLGRTTVDCIHCLDGKPISQTALSRDPITPVRNDDIQKIMAEAFAAERIVHIGLNAVRNGSFDISSGYVFCFDAALNSDLDVIVRAVLAVNKRVLWVGSSGLANSLLNVEQPLPPAMAVVASLSSLTRGQALFAEKQGVPLVKAPLYAIIEKKTTPEKIAADAIATLKEGRDVILLSSSTYSEEEHRKTEESARRAGLSTAEMSAFTRKIMSQITAQVLEGAKVSGLFLSGGDTAIGCFESLGAHGSDIDTEIALGIPLTRLTGGKYDGLKVITKAGAFGREDAVFYALRKLREV